MSHRKTEIIYPNVIKIDFINSDVINQYHI